MTAARRPSNSRLVFVRTAAALAGLVALAALHVVLARRTRLPIVQGDELGYLENARYLALGGARPANSYYPGLSMLVVPIWHLTRHGLSVWRGAQLVNVAATLFTALGAVVLGGMCGLSRSARWLVALAVSMYAPVLLYTDFSLSESVFQAVFMWLVIAVAAAVRRTVRPGHATGRWAFVGLLVGYATMVHPRGYAVTVALGLVALLHLRPIRLRLPELVGLSVGITGGMALVRLATVATRAANVVSRYDYMPNSLAYRTFRLDAVNRLIVSSIGRVFYQSVATAALVPLAVGVGLWGVVRLARRRGSEIDVVRGFAALSAVGVAAFTMVIGGTRPDQLVQGRYVDGVVAPLLVTGLAHVIVDKRWRLWAVSGLAVTIGSGILFSLTRHLVDTGQPLSPPNILGIELIVRHLSGRVSSLPLTLVGIASVVVLGLLVRRWPRSAVVVLAVAFCTSAIDTQLHFIEPGSTAKAGQTVLVHAITKSSTALGVARECVAYDAPTEDYNFFTDRLLLGTQELEFLEPGENPCGPLVISRLPRFEQRFIGAHLVVGENDVDENLYVLPGPTQDRLRKNGWLLPDATPGAVPTAHQRAAIRTAGVSTLRSGATKTIETQITNASQVSTWPATPSLGQKAYAVRVAVRWYPGSQDLPRPIQVPVATRVVDLPRSLLPGDTATAKVPLAAATNKGAKLPAGDYVVAMTVYQERNGDFAGTKTFHVKVTP